ncbi:PadR family transcriptional regulator [Tannockella kyphosi]|uniref:PadR family transcriptional regulator n=1 Tax=Tannockella kyphosi TaxID=2899121 RepID=UPI00201116E2|nr:PadR family transcriptional regulator [Tannockella kyphosi]
MAKKNIYFKFEMLILVILTTKDCYGYEITTKIRELSDGIIDIKEGSLYPTLYKMLDKGYISSNEVIVNRKIRVYYHLEESGIPYLEAMIEEYHQWENKIQVILNIKGEHGDE